MLLDLTNSWKAFSPCWLWKHLSFKNLLGCLKKCSSVDEWSAEYGGSVDCAL